MGRIKEKQLKPVPMKDLTVFKIANRKGYAAVCRNNLTEGPDRKTAVERMKKALKRSGLALQ